MPLNLAFADMPDSSDTGLRLVVIAIFIVGVVGLMATIVVQMARRRRHRRLETILAASLLWVLLSAGSAIYACIQHIQWSKEYLIDLQSGYSNPQDISDAPAWPWWLWAGLALFYILLLMYALSQNNPPLRTPAEPTNNGSQ